MVKMDFRQKKNILSPTTKCSSSCKMIYSAALAQDTVIKVLCKCNMVTNPDILTLFSITTAEGTAMKCKVTSDRFKTPYAWTLGSSHCLSTLSLYPCYIEYLVTHFHFLLANVKITLCLSFHLVKLSNHFSCSL